MNLDGCSGGTGVIKAPASNFVFFPLAPFNKELSEFHQSNNEVCCLYLTKKSQVYTLKNGIIFIIRPL
jgi:hypothetical protein